MQFDAKAEKKKKEREEKTHNKLTSRAKITDIYPVDGITDEGFIKFKYGTKTLFGEIFDIRKYDLNKLPINSADEIESAAASFYGEYQDSIKEIFRNFPERNQLQQGYFRRLMSRTNDIKRLGWIEDQLNILMHLEKTYSKMGSWQIIYADSVSELSSRISNLEKYRIVFGFYPVSISDKTLLFKLINNPGGLLNGEKREE